VDSGTINPTIDVSSFISNGRGDIPKITITSNNAGNAEIEIPATTVTSEGTTWNGIIAAPTVTTVTLPETSGQTKTLSTAIEIGFTGAKLSFDKAVRILLPSQAGKRAGYVRTGIDFTEITNTCVSSDDQAAVNADLVGLKEDCKINASNGLDLVIWTKHFTKFVTYTQYVPQSSSNVGGGYYATPTPTPTPTSTPTPTPTPTGIVAGAFIGPVTIPILPANPTNADYQNLLNALIQQLAYLRSLLAGQQGIVAGATTGYQFTHNLQLGGSGEDVRQLQIFLKAQGTEIYPEGLVTGYSGSLTKKAVEKFQVKYDIAKAGDAGYGYVGPKTRAKINSLQGL
jgi:hypothetical protein